MCARASREGSTGPRFHACRGQQATQPSRKEVPFPAPHPVLTACGWPRQRSLALIPSPQGPAWHALLFDLSQGSRPPPMGPRQASQQEPLQAPQAPRWE